jgi:hypothetical protein
MRNPREINQGRKRKRYWYGSDREINGGLCAVVKEALRGREKRVPRIFHAGAKLLSSGQETASPISHE